MFKVSSAQYDALSRDSEARFRDWVRGFFDDELTEARDARAAAEGVAPDALIDRLTDRARARGLHSFSAVSNFIAVALQTHPEFDADPEVDALFTRTPLQEDALLRTVVNAVRPATWRRLKAEGPGGD